MPLQCVSLYEAKELYTASKGPAFRMGLLHSLVLQQLGQRSSAQILLGGTAERTLLVEVVEARSSFSSAEQRLSSSGELAACHSHRKNQSTPMLPKMWNTLGHVSHCASTKCHFLFVIGNLFNAAVQHNLLYGGRAP